MLSIVLASECRSSWDDRRNTPAALLGNAASVFAPKPFVDHAYEDYDRYQALNRGFFFLTRTVAGDVIIHGTKWCRGHNG